ncbi:MAG: UDP-4-amino-4,6-dideoxy-N-acetyl-beta-L-altrosamine transaminase [Prochlorococcus marinus XMU1428]|nr:UDP-4-amino-4,6-dideoxy-N-acetyl-beta-L-altrosamine transaminase [Prochlorococcus marinus XMU1428]
MIRLSKKVNLKKNQFIPYGRQDINLRDIFNVLKILKSDFITNGPAIEKFENEISKYCKSRYALAVNSATSALHLSCLALNLKKGDWLWTSPISFVASANCGIYCGAKIDFVDINIENGLMDIKALESKLQIAAKNGTLPKVIIPVHLAGTSCDMESIFKLSKQYGFSIIEDASHAIGGKYKGLPVGSCKYSDITVFSFHPVKLITTGEGGAALTNNEKIAEKISDLRSHGIIKDQKRFIDQDPSPWLYEQQYLGFNYRITDIQASLGLSQLNRLDKFVSKRNTKLDLYKSRLKSEPINFLEIPKDVKSSLHLSIIQLNKELIPFHRQIFIELRKLLIGVQLHYLPIHLHPFYQKFGFKRGQFPKSELFANSSISIPLYPSLSYFKQLKVIKNLKFVLKNYK